MHVSCARYPEIAFTRCQEEKNESLSVCVSPHRNRWHVCGQSLEVVERRGVAVQDEIDGEVEGAEGDLETAAEAAEQDVLPGEALADAAVAVAAARGMVAVVVTRPRKR